MRSLLKLLAAMAASIGLYLICFGFLIHKPLTVADYVRTEERRLAYARSLQGPKLVIFAGSGARYSHSCAALSHKLNIPCANLGVAAGMGLDYLLTSLEGVLKPGDLIYMPLEYDQYLFEKSDRMYSAEAPELFYSKKGTLLSLGIGRFIHGMFSFDLKFAISGAAEMALERRGFSRRSSAETQNAWGDETINTAGNAAAYRTFIAALPFQPPTASNLARQTEAKELIGAFLERARARGIAVAGGLPTIFDDKPVSSGALEVLRNYYEAHGQSLLVLRNRSQYPRADFFDTGLHLIDIWQIRHSEAVGEALARSKAFINSFGRIREAAGDFAEAN